MEVLVVVLAVVDVKGKRYLLRGEIKRQQMGLPIADP